MPKKKGNKTEAKAAAKSAPTPAPAPAPTPAGEGEPERDGQLSEENNVGCGTEVRSELIAQRFDEKRDQVAGQHEQQSQQQTQQRWQQQQQPERGQEQEQQEKPAESSQPPAEETATAQATCDPEQDTSSDPTELLKLLKELGEADPDSLNASEEVPANLVTELLENGNLLEQLARTADELDALSNKFADMGEKMTTEHLQFEERLQSAEEQARNEALEAARRRDKFQLLQLDCESLMKQLTEAQEKLSPTTGAAAPDAGAVEAIPLVGEAPDQQKDATPADVPEEFEDASGQSQDDEPRQEFAEARDGQEDDEMEEEQKQDNEEERKKSHEDKDGETSDEDESAPENDEKKGWLGGWFKK